MTTHTPAYCTCCGRQLNEGCVVWLELDQRINQYHDFKNVPESFSQGWFEFGPSCAKRARVKARVFLKTWETMEIARVAVQACRQEDRAMLATPAGIELISSIARAEGK